MTNADGARDGPTSTFVPNDSLTKLFHPVSDQLRKTQKKWLLLTYGFNSDETMWCKKAFITNKNPMAMIITFDKKLPLFLCFSCMLWFTLEYIVRFAISPKKLVFLKSPLNIIDLLTIVPFYVEMCLPYIGIMHTVELRNIRGAFHSLFFFKNV